MNVGRTMSCNYLYVLVSVCSFRYTPLTRPLKRTSGFVWLISRSYDNSIMIMFLICVLFVTKLR
jgi:hypothetical protein